MSIRILEHGPVCPQVRSSDSVNITLFRGARCSVGRSAVTMKNMLLRVKVGRLLTALAFLSFSIRVQLDPYFFAAVLIVVCTVSL